MRPRWSLCAPHHTRPSRTIAIARLPSLLRGKNMRHPPFFSPFCSHLRGKQNKQKDILDILFCLRRLLRFLRANVAAVVSFAPLCVGPAQEHVLLLVATAVLGVMRAEGIRGDGWTHREHTEKLFTTKNETSQKSKKTKKKTNIKKTKSYTPQESSRDSRASRAATWRWCG